MERNKFMLCKWLLESSIKQATIKLCADLELSPENLFEVMQAVLFDLTQEIQEIREAQDD